MQAFIMGSNNLSDYLTASQYIDWQEDEVFEQAQSLANNTTDKAEVAKNCFEFVRDKIEHSIDYQRDGMSCSASQVLTNGHGFCYAKSHLLVALLRANDIPAGLCYQRLQMDTTSFGLHGLVAVYLPVDNEQNNGSNSANWYRLDPRGNKANINAEFSLQDERLAYQVTHQGEIDFAEILVEPLPCVVNVLTRYTSHKDILTHLPDLQVL